MKHERKTVRSRGVHLMAVLFLLAIVAGCAVRPCPIQWPGSPLAPPSEDQGWRAIRFRMDRIDKKTHWERDLLIAHRIIVPVLQTHAPRIPLWRFHRRSAGDDKGHQFSFLYYTGAREADLINRQIMADPLLKGLLSNHIVRGVLIDGADDQTRTEIGATSDANWSPVMQNAWPYYIMGVSRMWLDMIDQISSAIGIPADATPDQLVAHYGTVHTHVSQIWQTEGYHALLHHLNAIYGYKPLIFWEKRIKSY